MELTFVIIGCVVTYLVIMSACLATTKYLELKYAKKQKAREKQWRLDNPELARYSYGSFSKGDWVFWYFLDLVWPTWFIVGPLYGICVAVSKLVNASRSAIEAKVNA